MTSRFVAERPETVHLELRDICASYLKKEVLLGISLIVGSGEIVALFGGNGSGKSTVLKTVAGLLFPTGGTVSFAGRDITDASVPCRQQFGITLLLQGGRIFPNLTVEENLSVALRHRRHTRDQVPALGTLFPVLRDRRGTRAGLLSGGQRQMLALEMVLAQEPRIALLDEPSAGLSPSAVHDLLSTIHAVAKSTGMGILLAEQNAEEAKKIADRYYLLEHGAIVVNESVDNLIRGE
jgi:branched-chain amino acid transport system ATP-binding protein